MTSVIGSSLCPHTMKILVFKEHRVSLPNWNVLQLAMQRVFLEESSRGFLFSSLTGNKNYRDRLLNVTATGLAFVFLSYWRCTCHRDFAILLWKKWILP